MTDPQDAVFGMTDLEEALAGPEGAALREAVVDRLDGLVRRAESALATGLAPQGFTAACAIRDAVTTARDLLRPGS